MSRRRILVVDDGPELLRLLRTTLEVEGYDVMLASDGETAMRRIAEEQPDLVLLDVMIPVLDGWDVLQRLQREPHRPRVICLTAKEGQRDQVKGWRLGADEYVTKPFDVDRLLKLIPEVVNRTPEEQRERRRLALAELGVDANG